MRLWKIFDEKSTVIPYDLRWINDIILEFFYRIFNEEFKTNVKFVELSSPKEYNFYTDKIVVEAEEKSGTLITARLALELGRDIGAVPGEIFSPSAKGTNMLIREGAYPITSKSDLFSLLHLSEKENDEEDSQNKKQFEGNEKVIMDLLREPLDKDALLEKSKLSFTDFLTAFSSLEIDGYLQESFGEVRRLV